MLKLDLFPAARRFLDTLPPKQYRQVLRRILALMDDPALADSKLLEGRPVRSATAGEYRIIYDVVVEGDLRVIDIGKRNDAEVYRRLR
jgi:mRNA interferase RelE/StbE